MEQPWAAHEAAPPPPWRAQHPEQQAVQVRVVHAMAPDHPEAAPYAGSAATAPAPHMGHAPGPAPGAQAAQALPPPPMYAATNYPPPPDPGQPSFTGAAVYNVDSVPQAYPHDLDGRFGGRRERSRSRERRHRSRSRERRRSRSRDRDRDQGRRRERSRSRDRGAYGDHRRERDRQRRRGDDDHTAGMDRDRSPDGRRGSGSRSDHSRRSHSRDRHDYMRDRDRDRERDRDHEREREREYDRDRDRGRDRDRDREHTRDRDRDRDDWRRPAPRPSRTVYLNNLPPEYEEVDVQRLLAAFPNVVAVRISRERMSRLSRGFAFVDFATETDAARLIDGDVDEPMFAGSHRISVQYALESAPGERQGASEARFDWVCPMCHSVNFARRTECYKCSAAQPANPQRASTDADGPSTVLKVSNLDDSCSEASLHDLFSAHAPLLDVRLVKDKFTGMPRGFAFVEYQSTADATRAMNMLQGVHAAGTAAGGLRICYARDRLSAATGPHNPSSKGHDALQAAQAMSQQYSAAAWEPQSFQGDTAAAWEPQAYGEGGEEQGGGKGEQGKGASTSERQEEATQGGQAAGAGHTDGSARAGFVYDQSTGYWYDSASGYYYDANTGLYYHRSTNQWYSYNQETGEYTTAGDTSATASADAQPAARASSVAESAIAATESAMAAQALAQPKASGERKRGAVIGASAQYNSQGLMQMVQMLDEKEQQQKALQAQKAAEQSAKQAKAKPAAAAAAAAAAAPVQGVIHKGKWAARNNQG